MTPDEFEFWQKAYLAALAGLSTLSFEGKYPDLVGVKGVAELANDSATLSLDNYRTAKATVVQTTYATPD